MSIDIHISEMVHAEDLPPVIMKLRAIANVLEQQVAYEKQRSEDIDKKLKERIALRKEEAAVGAKAKRVRKSKNENLEKGV
jgi:hypothetical protein